MYSFIITVNKDFRIAKEILPKVGFLPYKMAINTVWKGVVQIIAVKRLKDYSPSVTSDLAVFSCFNTDRSVLENERKELEKFLFGSADELKNDERMRRGLNNRWVNRVYVHCRNYIIDKITGENVLNFLNSISISVKWELSAEDKNLANPL